MICEKRSNSGMLKCTAGTYALKAAKLKWTVKTCNAKVIKMTYERLSEETVLIIREQRLIHNWLRLRKRSSG